jgi:hypothetical protein
MFRIRWSLLAAALVVSTAACTGQPTPQHDPPTSSAPPMPAMTSASPTPSPTPPRAVVRAPDRSTTVVEAATPQQVSVAVARALFVSAPAVVVSAPDQASVASAASDAERLGVPLLIAERAAAPPPAGVTPPSASATPPSAGASAAADTSVLDDEVRRLGARQLLLVGAVRSVDSLPAVSDATALRPVRPPVPVRDTTVLVPAGADAGARAAAATATAAGAAVVPVHGGDPRADAAAVRTLAARPVGPVLAVGAAFGPADRLASRLAVARTGRQLPGGGQVVFPGRRFVAIYGHPSGPALGILGAQGLDASIVRARQLAAPYQQLSKVPVVPAFEIIATVAHGAPGADGNYSGESSLELLRPWVEQAQAAGLYVVLDLQPGRADILEQAKRYAPLLQMPNVGLAIDPEWALSPTQLPLHQIGSIDAARINAVAGWLDQLTAEKHLPQKLFVVHQFRLSMIGNERQLRTDYDNVALLIHMDGQGTPPSKDATWHAVVGAAPKGVPFGWKNFTKQDHPMLTPEQTMSRSPAPMMISYQ